MQEQLRTIEEWQRSRAEVMASEVASRALRSIDGSKSMYQIGKEASLEFHSLVKAFRKLEQKGLITATKENGKRKSVKYSWTYKGVLLLPDLAPDDPRASLINSCLGDWNEAVRYLAESLQLSQEDATFVLNRILALSFEFLNWLREEAIIRRGEIPDLEDTEFYREQMLNFLTYALTTATELVLQGLSIKDKARIVGIGLQVLEQRHQALTKLLGEDDKETVQDHACYG